MSKKLLPKHIEFLKKNVRGKTYAELTILFNKHFKTDFSLRQVWGLCQRYGISNGKSYAEWTPEMKDYIKSNYQKATSIKDLLVMVNAYFETNFTIKQLGNFLWKNHQKIDLQLRSRSSRSGVFAKPMYSEKLNSKGYVVVRVSMTGTQYEMWKGKHSLVWEQAYGKIPKGRQIIFLDGNKLNCALENLAMVSREECLRLSQYGLRFGNAAATLAGIAVVRHRLSIHSCIKKTLGKRGFDAFINRESAKRIRERSINEGEKSNEKHKG